MKTTNEYDRGFERPYELIFYNFGLITPGGVTKVKSIWDLRACLPFSVYFI